MQRIFSVAGNKLCIPDANVLFCNPSHSTLKNPQKTDQNLQLNSLIIYFSSIYMGHNVVDVRGCKSFVSWVEMSKRAAWPGHGETRPVLGPARQARLKNRAGPAKHTGSISCPSPARNGPKRAGPVRLARKKRAEKRAMRAEKHVLV
jgi:hypothetical protein